MHDVVSINVSFCQTQVKEARRTLRSPRVTKFDATEHESKFWCYCCGVEVPKHVTDGKVTVLHGGLLEHMSTYGDY